MKTDRLLGILGFVLALVGGILLLRSGVDFGQGLEAIARSLVDLILGVLAIVGGFLLFTRRYQQGGLLCLLVGVVGLVLTATSEAASVLVLLGGVLGLVASAS